MSGAAVLLLLGFPDFDAEEHKNTGDDDKERKEGYENDVRGGKAALLLVGILLVTLFLLFCGTLAAAAATAATAAAAAAVAVVRRVTASEQQTQKEEIKRGLGGGVERPRCGGAGRADLISVICGWFKVQSSASLIPSKRSPPTSWSIKSSKVALSVFQSSRNRNELELEKEQIPSTEARDCCISLRRPWNVPPLVRGGERNCRSAYVLAL